MGGFKSFADLAKVATGISILVLSCHVVPFITTTSSIVRILSQISRAGLLDSSMCSYVTREFVDGQ